ncbi:hypothetical protein [Fluviispira vulneris]|uniref:hypothetical protein n=1 Tax=Fluviispira vulneris TaxID=2763012 RepID=UPI0016471714|nr:hypothetical protein [Fluviispira vulneris]
MHIYKGKFNSIFIKQKIKSTLSFMSVFATAFSMQAHAQNSTQHNKPDPTEDVAGGVGEAGFNAPKYAVLPTGKTLPKGIFKLDLPFAYTFGSDGFDSTGNSVQNGLSMERWVNGIQLQYGLTNSISVGVGIPIVLSNHVQMDGNKIVANSEMYERYYNKFVNEFATQLSAQGRCPSVQACTNQINDGSLTLPAGQTNIILPTGEVVTFTAGDVIKDQIRNTLLTASQPENGATGIGDLQFGILWSVISEESPIRHVPLYVAVGGGLRLPTGKFSLPNAVRGTGGDNTLLTGGGTYDVIARLNVDYVAMPGLIFSWQHMSEYSLNKVNFSRSSMLNSDAYNTADPNYSTTNGHGDKQANILTFKRKGLHNIGFFQVAWGVGNATETLKWLGLFSQFKYNFAAKAYLNDQPINVMGDQFFLGDSSMHPDHGAEQYYSVLIGSKFSGLPYRIPLEFAGEFEYPIAGKNRAVSPMNVKGTLSLYF